jgi:hypothetical protein
MQHFCTFATEFELKRLKKEQSLPLHIMVSEPIWTYYHIVLKILNFSLRFFPLCHPIAWHIHILRYV